MVRIQTVLTAHRTVQHVSRPCDRFLLRVRYFLISANLGFYFVHDLYDIIARVYVFYRGWNRIALFIPGAKRFCTFRDRFDVFYRVPDGSARFETISMFFTVKNARKRLTPGKKRTKWCHVKHIKKMHQTMSDVVGQCPTVAEVTHNDYLTVR